MHKVSTSAIFSDSYGPRHCVESSAAGRLLAYGLWVGANHHGYLTLDCSIVLGIMVTLLPGQPFKEATKIVHAHVLGGKGKTGVAALEVGLLRDRGKAILFDTVTASI